MKVVVRLEVLAHRPGEYGGLNSSRVVEFNLDIKDLKDADFHALQEEAIGYALRDPDFVSKRYRRENIAVLNFTYMTPS